MPEQAPSVGRIVHYVARGSADGKFPPVCRAAIVTAVDPHGSVAGLRGIVETVDLAVLNPTGLFFDQGLVHNEDNGPGTWHWPERV